MGFYQQAKASNVPVDGGIAAFSYFLGSLSPTQLLGDDRQNASTLIDRAFTENSRACLLTSADINGLIGVFNKAFEKALGGHRPVRQVFLGNLSQCVLGEKPLPFIVALALKTSEFLSNQGEFTAALKLLAISEPLAEKRCSDYVHAGFAFLRGRISNRLGNLQEAEDHFRVAMTKTSFCSFNLGGLISVGQAIDEIQIFCQFAGVSRHSQLHKHLSELFSDIKMASKT